MNISPINSIGYNTYFKGKTYNKHKADKTADFVEVESMSKKGRNLVQKIDNRTNLTMKEFEAIGEAAEILKEEFTPELYLNLKKKSEGKISSEIPKGYLFDDSYNKVLKTDCNEFGIVTQKVAKYNDDGTLDNVRVRKQRMGKGYDAIFDEEKYEFKPNGRLAKYTISANAATKEGYSCEERRFVFNENCEDGSYDNYKFSSSTGEYSECDKASSVIFYNGENPPRPDVVSHSFYKQDGREQKIGKAYIEGTNYAHFFEEKSGKEEYYETTSLRKPKTSQDAIQKGEVSFSGKKVYNKHNPDKTANFAQVETLDKKGMRFVHTLDNRTNLTTKEFNSIGEEAEKLKEEFSESLYQSLLNGEDSISGYEIDPFMGNFVVKTDVNEDKKPARAVKKTARFEEGSLKSVRVVTKTTFMDGTCTLDHEDYHFNKNGKLVKYEILTRADLGSGLENEEKRVFEFEENGNSGTKDHYKYISKLEGYSDINQETEIFYSDGDNPHPETVQHRTFEKNLPYAQKKVYMDGKAYLTSEEGCYFNNLQGIISLRK